MSKFKSHKEYDHWRSQQALKRGGAKDLQKLDAERPPYSGAKLRGFGLWEVAVLAMFGAACVVFMFSVPGRALLGKLYDLLVR